MLACTFIMAAMALAAAAVDIECPASCTCENRPESGSQLNVTCSYEGLTTIPDLSSLRGISIHSLDLSLNSISEIADSAFEGLSVTEINLSFNPISTISSRAFEGLEDTLKSLMLRQTDLSSMPSTFLVGFTKLEMLNISDTINDILTSLTKETFGDLPALMHLSLKYCNITDVSDDAFEGMEALSVLSLNENKMTSVPDAIKTLRNLRELDLSMNKILQINDEDFQGLDRMEILKMGWNVGIEFSADAFRPLGTKLHNLSLAWSDMAVVPPEIRVLQDLQHLDLSGNLITEIGGDAFLGLADLEILDLSENLGVAISGPESFNGMQNSLKKLDLSQTSLADIPVESLEALSHLETLDLSRNKLTSVGDLSKVTAKTLDLSLNEITSVVGPFNQGPLDLDLSFNNFTQTDFIDDVCQFERINLVANKLNCTCEMLAVSMVFGVIARGYCAIPIQLYNKPFIGKEVVDHFTDHCGYAERSEPCDWFTADAASFDLSATTSVLCAVIGVLHFMC